MSRSSISTTDSMRQVTSRSFSQPEIFAAFQKLDRVLGSQHWWPGESPFEVIVGAILTQNTAWTNVEQAIAQLKRARLLSPRAMERIPTRRLARLIRPAGYFNQKAKKLKNFLRFLRSEYSGALEKMLREPTAILRPKLLSVNGIGEETADSILLYAAQRPTFVIDAYTRRIAWRHRWIRAEASYGELQQLFLENLPREVSVYNQYHALLVEIGKHYCLRSRALCASCPLEEFLDGAPATP